MNKKFFNSKILIISLCMLIACSTIIAIDIIFINLSINRTIIKLALVLLIVSFILLIICISNLLGKLKTKNAKSHKPLTIGLVVGNVCIIVSFVILFMLLFAFVISLIAGAFWSAKNEINLGVYSDNVNSGELYIGKLDDDKITIEFNGSVSLTDIDIIDEEYEIEISELEIDGVLLTKIENPDGIDCYDVSSYTGDHNYRIKLSQRITVGSKDGYYGFTLINKYNEKINTTISSDYTMNYNTDPNSFTLNIFKDGTPYQYRYAKGLIIVRWIVLIIYCEIIAIYPPMSIIILVSNKKEEENEKKSYSV